MSTACKARLPNFVNSTGLSYTRIQKWLRYPSVQKADDMKLIE